MKTEMIREDDCFGITFSNDNDVVISVILSKKEAEDLLKLLDANLYDYWIEQHGME